MAENARPSRRGETQRHYPPELNERAVRLVHETIAEVQAGPEGAPNDVA